MNSAARALLRPLVAPLWPAFRELIVLSTFVNLLALGVPIFVMQVYDRVVFHAGLATLQGLVIGVAIVLVFDWILRQARARILQGIALRVDIAVGRNLFEKLLALPLAGLEKQPAAHWHSLFRDVDVVRYEPNSVILSKGLQPGETIVTAGVQSLHPGQKVRLLGGST